VAVHPPGRSDQPTASPVTMWIDLASPEHCDAGPDSLTTMIWAGLGRLACW
jgi:hypothetical protein